MSRTRNVKLNIYSGITNQIIVNVLQFVNRTIFIWYLNENYLGINGLFTSVLSALSLAELGIGSAIGFSLYKPLAEKDVPKIQALMTLYKKAYRIIGAAVCVIGLALIPFLDKIVNFDYSVDINYYLVYILFLFDTVISYLFFAYRAAIITTDQKEYTIVKYKILNTVVASLAQIGTLVIFKNYYIYLIIPIATKILQNILISIKAGKMYPYIDEKHNNKLTEKEKKTIFKNVYALAVTKIGTVVYYSGDSIVISAFVGTVYTGIYSNYLIILNTLRTFINIIFGAFSSSVGNLNAIETTEKKKLVFKRMLLINVWIYGFCAIALNQLFNPFIKLWIGEKYLFDEKTKVCIVMMFFITGLCHTVTVFKDSCGIFWQTRYRELASAITNIVLSIIFVQFWGILGVFVATVIAYVLIIMPIDPRILYREVFHEKAWRYYGWLVASTIKVVAIMIIIHLLCIPFSEGWKGFIVQVLIVLVMSNVLLLVTNIMSKEILYFKELILSKFKK